MVLPGTGGIVLPGTGGMVLPGIGGILLPGTGGIVLPGTGGIVLPGIGGIVLPGTGGMVLPGTGGILPLLGTLGIEEGILSVDVFVVLSVVICDKEVLILFCSLKSLSFFLSLPKNSKLSFIIILTLANLIFMELICCFNFLSSSSFLRFSSKIDLFLVSCSSN